MFEGSGRWNVHIIIFHNFNLLLQIQIYLSKGLPTCLTKCQILVITIPADPLELCLSKSVTIIHICQGIPIKIGIIHWSAILPFRSTAGVIKINPLSLTPEITIETCILL